MYKKFLSVAGVVIVVVLWGGLIKGCMAFCEYNAATEAEAAKKPKVVVDAGLDPKVVAQVAKEDAAAERKREAFYAQGRSIGLIRKMEFRDRAVEAMVSPSMFMALPMDSKRGFCAALVDSARFRNPAAGGGLGFVSDYRTERRIGRCSSEFAFELED